MNQELKINIKFSLIAISFVLIFFSGYYVKSYQIEMDVGSWKGFFLYLMGIVGGLINLLVFSSAYNK